MSDIIKLNYPRIYEELKELVCTCEPLYPGIDLWFKRKVLPDLLDGAREAFVCDHDSSLVGAYIIKHKSASRIKICLMRVLPHVRSCGFGREMLSNIVGQHIGKEIYFTAPEPIALEYKDWFAGFGFKWNGKADKTATAYGDEILFSNRGQDDNAHFPK